MAGSGAIIWREWQALRLNTGQTEDRGRSSRRRRKFFGNIEEGSTMGVVYNNTYYWHLRLMAKMLSGLRSCRPVLFVAGFLYREFPCQLNWNGEDQYTVHLVQSFTAVETTLM